MTKKILLVNIEEIRDYCLSKTGVTESFPFDETTLVFKVMGKMFSLINLDGEPALSLKNTPEKVMELQERYSFVLPGYHLNKIHWIRVMVEQTISDKMLLSWIDESYDRVVNGLPRKLQQEHNKLINHD